MNIFRAGSRIISRSNPALLIASGAAIALSLPPVRRGLRSAAVVVTRGLIKAKEGAQSLGSRFQEAAEDIVAEAKDFQESSNAKSACEMVESMGDSLKEHGREMAVTATAGALAVKDKAADLVNEFKDMSSDAGNPALAVQESEKSHDELAGHHDSPLGNEQGSLEKENRPRRRRASKEPL